MNTTACTHSLSSAGGGGGGGGGPSQDLEEKRTRDTHLLSNVERGVQSAHRKKCERAEGTYGLLSAEGVTGQETERKRAGEGTHVLSRTERGTSKDTGRKRTSKRYSHPMMCGGWVSQDTKMKRARVTHFLLRREAGTS
jgi:hypothetical protein